LEYLVGPFFKPFGHLITDLVCISATEYSNYRMQPKYQWSALRSTLPNFSRATVRAVNAWLCPSKMDVGKDKGEGLTKSLVQTETFWRFSDFFPRFSQLFMRFRWFVEVSGPIWTSTDPFEPVRMRFGLVYLHATNNPSIPNQMAVRKQILLKILLNNPCETLDYRKMFANFWSFQSFSSLEVFGVALTCWDLLGCVQIHSDASACVRMHSDPFEKFVPKIRFSHFWWTFWGVPQKRTSPASSSQFCAPDTLTWRPWCWSWDKALG